jgi:hypothetical protein
VLYAVVAAGIVVFLGVVAAGSFALRAGSSPRAIAERVTSAAPTERVRATAPVATTSPKPPDTGAARATAPKIDPQQPKIDPQQPATVNDVKLPPAVLRTQEWWKRTLTGDYERIGRKGERWEADAREILRLAAETWNNRYRDGATLSTIHQRAERAGCKEPIVGYAVARLAGNAGWRHDLTATRMDQSAYHPAHRCLALIRASQWYGLRGEGEDARQKALKLFPEAAADRELPTGVFLEMCEQLELSYLMVTKDRKIGFDKIEAELVKARPDSSILHTYRGTFYTRYAWDARGGGWANTVTDDGWRLFGQRLDVAAKALEKAWELDQTNSDAARAMITVELGQGQGRQRMELWFGRAMTADPDNFDACKAKVYYLEPKWHGSPEAMLEFGRECLKTGNYRGRLPLILADAHEAIAVYNRENPDTYFQRPGVWPDIRAAYEPYLKAYPKACLERSRYANLACRSEQWETAHQQFGLLGDDAQYAIFGGQNRYDQLRQEAARWAQLPPKR